LSACRRVVCVHCIVTGVGRVLLCDIDPCKPCDSDNCKILWIHPEHCTALVCTQACRRQGACCCFGGTQGQATDRWDHGSQVV
jgi:hypothetical protein